MLDHAESDISVTGKSGILVNLSAERIAFIAEKQRSGISAGYYRRPHFASRVKFCNSLYYGVRRDEFRFDSRSF